MQTIPAAMTTIWDRPGFLVRRLHQIHVALFLANVAGGDITPVQYGLVSILLARPGIDQFTLGEELGLDAANVTGVVSRMEARGLVRRQVDPANRRRKLCFATSAGEEFVRRHYRQMQVSQNRLLSPLSPADRHVFIDLLSQLVAGNNEAGRTALRPGGEEMAVGKAAKARRRRAA